jgi:hypothetical protein
MVTVEVDCKLGRIKARVKAKNKRKGENNIKTGEAKSRERLMEIIGRLGSGACSLSLVLICFASLDSGFSVLCGSAVAWLSVSRALLETMG